MFGQRSFLFAALLATAGVAACSSDGEARCLGEDSSAQVCITGSDFDYEVQASGLEPGSTLLFGTNETAATGEIAFVIGADGAPDGSVGLLGDYSGKTISISATMASGAILEGEIEIVD